MDQASCDLQLSRTPRITELTSSSLCPRQFMEYVATCRKTPSLKGHTASGTCSRSSPHLCRLVISTRWRGRGEHAERPVQVTCGDLGLKDVPPANEEPHGRSQELMSLMSHSTTTGHQLLVTPHLDHQARKGPLLRCEQNTYIPRAGVSGEEQTMVVSSSLLWRRRQLHLPQPLPIIATRA